MDALAGLEVAHGDLELFIAQMARGRDAENFLEIFSAALSTGSIPESTAALMVVGPGFFLRGGFLLALCPALRGS